MNNTFKKIIKGTIAIFAIKLVLVGGLFIFQSCQTDSLVNEDNEEAKSIFLASLKMSSEKLSTITVKNPKKSNSDDSNIMARDMQGATETVCLMFHDGTTTTTDEIIEDINTLTELIQTKTNHNLVTQFDLNWDSDTDGTDDSTTDSTNEPDFNPEDCVALIEIPLQPTSDALNPAIQEAKNYLISSYGFSNQEINEMIADEIGQEEDLVLLVMAMANAENSNNGTAFNYMSLFGESAYAQDWEQIGNCAMVAIGADVLYSLATADPAMGSKWKKKAIKKAFGVVAKRMLGPIGVAIAVVSFALCMSGN